jgi:cell division protein FtsI (penicillin-binding protein 3)
VILRRLRSYRRSRRAERARREERAAAPPGDGRRRFVLFLFAAVAVVMVSGAIERQILDVDFLQKEGARRYLTRIEIPVHRGQVTDRTGSILAASAPVDSVWANPRLLRADEATLRRLAKALDMDLKELHGRLDKAGKRGFIYLRRRALPEQVERVMAVVDEHDIPGIDLEREYRRYYPDGEVFAHVVGFTDIEDNGQEGLELAYNETLKGVPGQRRVIRDGRRWVVKDVESVRAPKPGTDIALSLDRRLQYLAYRELKAAVQKHKAKSASLVLLDVQTGEVLAMVNQPSYNPNGDRSGVGGRLRNRAATDLFEPGSTMKPFTVAIAMDAGRIRADSRIDTSPGYFHVGQHRVKDHHNLGLIDIATLLRKSSNVGSAKIALELSAEMFWRGLSNLGFGQPTGAGFTGEAGGVLAAPKEWARIEQATISFGYGLSTTPLQLARAYAVLAADGLRRPVSLRKVDEPPAGQRVIRAETARAVRGMLESVATKEGTAPLAAVPRYRVAGKTGTVRKLGRHGYETDEYLALFAGMAPARNPRFALVVMISEPSAGKYYGGEVAAPVFSAVMEGALRLYNVPPDADPATDIRLAQVGGGR